MLIYSYMFAAAIGLTQSNVITAELQAKHSGTAPNAQFCYVPSKSNVSYQDLNGLHTEKPDHIISYGSDPLQFAELWLPSKSFSAGHPPLLVLIHGGCWLNAFDIEHTHALSTALRHSGYAVWSIEYRRTGQNNHAFNHRNAAIIGHSAGGHLALLAGAELKDKAAIKAVIGLAPIVDIAKYAAGSNSCEIATPKFMNGTPEQQPLAYRSANPISLTPHPTTVLIQGGLDNIVAPEQSTYLPQATTIMVEGAGHFDMVHPNTPSFQKLLQQLGQKLKP